MALLFNGSYEEIRSSPIVHLNSPAVYGRRQLFARESECAKEQSVAQVRWSRAVRGQWRGRRIYGAFHPTQSREDNHDVQAGQGWFLYRLSRHNGRVLARLQKLEQRIGTGGPPAAAGLAGVRQASGKGPVRGLAVGGPAPDFELPAADGRRVSLRALLGRDCRCCWSSQLPGAVTATRCSRRWPAGSTSIATASPSRS